MVYIHAYVFSEAVPVTLSQIDEDDDSLYIQLYENTKSERQRVQEMMEEGIEQSVAEHRVRQWYKLQNEVSDIRMHSSERQKFEGRLKDIASDKNAFRLFLDLDFRRDYAYLGPDECKKLYGDFLTHLKDAEDQKDSAFYYWYVKWMQACKYGGWIYLH
jgi:hypothetical protein